MVRAEVIGGGRGAGEGVEGGSGGELVLEEDFGDDG